MFKKESKMANSAWFDNNYYMQQKIQQMKAIHWRGKSDWDEAGYRAELNRFGVTAQENFEACNTSDYVSGINMTAVNVSPNPLFDVNVYVQNYVNYANGVGHYNYGTTLAGQWTVPNMLEHIFNDLHMSAWAHFQKVGMELELNPSNLFDTSKYLASRVQAMNSYVNKDGSIGWEGRADWTTDDVLTELQDSGENPLEDYFDFGNPTLKVEATKPAIPTSVIVPDGWTQWGTPEEPEKPYTPTPVKPVPSVIVPGDSGPSTPSEPTDPYDEIDETIVLTSDKSEYVGKDGQNTLFEGAYEGVETGPYLLPNYTISGGANSDNTLM